MPTIITVCNEDGGAGKAYAAAQLAAAYAKLGGKVLFIGLDPKGWASKILGHKRDAGLYVFDLLRHFTEKGGADFSRAVRKSKLANLDYIPSDTRMDMADSVLADTMQLTLKKMLAHPEFDRYGYIFLDAPRQPGVLMINALAAGNYAVIPIHPRVWGGDGLEKLIEKIRSVKGSLNPRLELGGILLVQCGREAMSKNAARELRGKYPWAVLKTQIPEIDGPQDNGILWADKPLSRIGGLYISCAKELMKREMAHKAKVLGIVFDGNWG